MRATEGHACRLTALRHSKHSEKDFYLLKCQRTSFIAQVSENKFYFRLEWSVTVIESMVQIFVIKVRGHDCRGEHLKNERGESKNLNDSCESTLDVVRSGDQTGHS